MTSSASTLSNRKSGITLVEVLIALAIFAAVMSLAYAAMIGGLTTQNTQEATVSAQAKLRRVVEVVSQDIRSAVFGSIIDSPYVSDADSVSFMLLTGGAGYALEHFDSGDTQIEILSSSTAPLLNKQVVLVNQLGAGVLTRVNHVANLPGKRRLTLSCGVNLSYTTNTLLFEVSSLGIDYDPEEQQLNIRSGFGGLETPLAFDISDFRVDFIYTADGEEPLVEVAPHRPAGAPERHMTVGGTQYTLSRLQFVVSSDAITRNGTQTHSYSAQVDLLESQDFMIRELTTCP